MDLHPFTEACLGDNSILELIEALARGPDTVDMRNWEIDEARWLACVQAALAINVGFTIEDEDESRSHALAQALKLWGIEADRG